MWYVIKRMTEHGFSLALKTEVVCLTKETIALFLPVQIGETMVLSKPAVKYLSIMLDTKISFFEQI